MKSVRLGAVFCAVACALVVGAPVAARTREKVLYSFCSQQNCVDGGSPDAGVIDVAGTLYGTTLGGGAYGFGAVFAFDPTTGQEQTLHSFSSGTDGQYPYAGLTNDNGTLYGTATLGGAYNEGAVFAINPSTGAETVVYSFCSQQACADGAFPLWRSTQCKGRALWHDRS